MEPEVERRTSLYTSVQEIADEEARMDLGQITPPSSGSSLLPMDIIRRLNEAKQQQNQFLKDHLQVMDHVSVQFQSELDQLVLHRVRSHKRVHMLAEACTRMKKEIDKQQQEKRIQETQHQTERQAVFDLISSELPLEQGTTLQEAVRLLLAHLGDVQSENEQLRSDRNQLEQYNGDLKSELAETNQQLCILQKAFTDSKLERQRLEDHVGHLENMLEFTQDQFLRHLTLEFQALHVPVRTHNGLRVLSEREDFQLLPDMMRQSLMNMDIVMQSKSKAVNAAVSLDPFDLSKLDDALDRHQHLTANSNLFQWPPTEAIDRFRKDLEHDLNQLGLRLTNK